MGKVDLSGTLPIGAFLNGTELKEYTLLRSNGIAEKVYTDRIQEKPYTWIANVLTIGIDNLEGHKIGPIARAEYSSSEEVTIPEVIKSLSLAAANTLLIELHRKTWQKHIPDQECFCKYCGFKNILDVNLDNLKMHEEDLKRLRSKENWSELECDLETGYTFTAKQMLGGSKEDKAYSEFDGITFNRLVFRNPNLGDAIALEKQAATPVIFWRRLAFRTLQKVLALDGDGNILTELPLQAVHMSGMKLFDEELDRDDLKAIRSCIRDVPTLPFDYLIECKSCRAETPMIIEGSELFAF